MSELTFIVRVLDKTKEGMAAVKASITGVTNSVKEGASKSLTFLQDLSRQVGGTFLSVASKLAPALGAATAVFGAGILAVIGSATNAAESLKDKADMTDTMRKNVDTINASSGAIKSALSDLADWWGEKSISWWGAWVREAAIAQQRVINLFKGKGFGRDAAEAEVNTFLNDSPENKMRRQAEVMKNLQAAADSKEKFRQSRLTDEQKYTETDASVREKEDQSLAMKNRLNVLIRSGRGGTAEAMDLSDRIKEKEKEIVELLIKRDQLHESIEARKRGEAEAAEAEAAAVAEAEKAKNEAAEREKARKAELERIEKNEKLRDKAAIAKDKVSARAELIQDVFSAGASEAREKAQGKTSEAEHLRRMALDKDYRKQQEEEQKAREKEEKKFQRLLEDAERGVRSKEISAAVKSNKAMQEAVRLEREAQALEKAAWEAQVEASKRLKSIDEALAKSLTLK